MKRLGVWVIVMTFGLVASGCATPRPGVYAYPQKGQTAEQLNRDQYECEAWAARQTGYDPAGDTAKGAGLGALLGALTGAAAGAAIGAATGSAGTGALGLGIALTVTPGPASAWGRTTRALSIVPDLISTAFFSLRIATVTGQTGLPGTGTGRLWVGSGSLHTEPGGTRSG